MFSPRSVYNAFLLLLLGLVACGTPAGPNSPVDEAPEEGPPILNSAAISGRVLDTNSSPIAGLQVTAISAGGGMEIVRKLASEGDAVHALASAMDTTKEDGSFKLAVEEEGVYTVTAIGNGIGALVTVSLGSGEDGVIQRHELELFAQPLGAIRGMVQVEGGENHSGVLVYAMGTSFVSLSNSSGEFLLSNVPPGEYELGAMKSGYRLGATQKAAVGSGDLVALEHPLTVRPPQQPLITEVSPTIVLPGDEIVIQGRGFGPSRNLSIVEYGGIQFPSQNIVSWSDEAITLVHPPAGNYPDFPSGLPLEKRVFSVRTANGEAIGSAPVQLLMHATLHDFSCCPYEEGEPVEVGFNLSALIGGLEGITVDISSDRGTASASSYWLEAGVSAGEFTLFPESDQEPHEVTISYEGRTLASRTFVCCDIDNGQPVITGTDKGFAAIGESFTIFGRNFGDSRGTSRVTFGTKDAANEDYAFWSDTEIRVRIPEGAASEALTVRVASAEVVAPAPVQVLQRLEIVSGDWQSAAPEAELPSPMRVGVFDTSGRPISGVPVAFSAMDGQLSATSKATDEEGTAETVLTLGSKAERHRVLATVPGLEPVAFQTQRLALHMVAGDNQEGVVGTELEESLVLRVQDEEGSGVNGVRVEFSSESGSLSASEAVSDENGLASIVFTLSNRVERTTIQGAVAGAGVVAFTAQGNPAAVVVNGPSGRQLAYPGGPELEFTVVAVDGNGAEIPGATTTFRSTAPSILEVADSAYGTVNMAVKGSGAVLVVAKVGTVESQPLSLDLYLLAPPKLIAGGNQVGLAGELLAAPVIVKVTDTSGRGVQDISVEASVERGSATLNPASGKSDEDGIFSTRVLLGCGEETNQLNFRVPGAQPVISLAIDAVSKRFIKTSSLNSRRSSHTSTRLSDGTALIAGGYYSSTTYRSAELFNPLSRRFEYTGEMNYGRRDHAATLLEDGTVLIVGGTSASMPVREAEVFDPATGEFTVVGKMSTSGAAIAIRLKDGRVFIIGSGFTELYDPERNAFEVLDPIATRYYRGEYTVTLLEDGRVLIAGGTGYVPDDGYLPVTQAEIFDPETRTFAATGSLVHERRRHTATLLSDGRVLIVGGEDRYGPIASAELFDPTTGKFEVIRSLLAPRVSHTATRLLGGDVLFVGGRGEQGTATKLEVYRFNHGTFELAGDLPYSPVAHTASLLADGKVLFSGGFIGFEVLASGCQR